MGQSPHLYALKYLSQKSIEISIYDIASAIVAETIFVQKANGGDNDILGTKYKNQLKSLAKLDRESLYRYIRSNSSDEWLKSVWDKTKKPWWYKLIGESTISLQPFIDKVNDFEVKNNRPYPIGDEIVCGKNIWHKECDAEQQPNHEVDNNYIKKTEEVSNLYDELVTKRGVKEGGEFEYIWQWKISKAEYDTITKKLKECKDINIDVLLKNTKCVGVFVIYIAEHYKRYWNGNDRNANALSQIGFCQNTLPEKIALKYFGQDSQKIFKHDSGSHEWLRSIQVEGGLPVHYVVSHQTTSMAGFAYNIWGDRKDVEDALEDLNDKTIIHSYQSGYSVYAYVNEIRNGGIANVCSVGDCDNDLYKDFIDFLEKGRSRKIQDKFYLRYRVWKSARQFTVYRTIRMRECNYEDYDEFPSDVISAKRLTGLWGIAEPSYVFALSFAGIKLQFVPHNAVGAAVTSYRSSTWESELELPPLSSDNISQPIVVKYISQDNDYVKTLSPELKFPPEGYIEFRKVNNFEWKDKESYRAHSEVAAVLFDADKWEIPGVEEISPVQGHRWTEFSESIELVSRTGQQNRMLYNSAERVHVEPDPNSIHPIAKLPYVKIENNKIRLEGNGWEKDAYLLQHPVKFDAIQINSEPYRKLHIESVEYRKPDDCRYEKYEENMDLAGYVIFRVTTNGVPSKPIDCYILPSEATVSRRIEETKGTITYSCPNSEDIRIKDMFDVDVNEDYRSVRIEDVGDCRFDLKVARPFRRRDRFRGDTIDETNNAIPIRFFNQYQVRVMDENGVSRKSVDIDSRSKLMLKLREVVLDRNSIKIRVDKFTYKAYTKPIYYDSQLKKYYADSGKDVNAKNLCFKFLTLNDDSLTDVSLQEEIGTRGCKYLTLNFDNNSDGVILQSLFDENGKYLSPIGYYEPKYVSSKQESVDEDTKILRRVKRLCNYIANENHPLEEATFKHFDFVCTCGCYFVVMDRLYALTYTPSCCNCDKEYCIGGVHIKSCDIRKKFSNKSVEANLAKFYLGYCEYCSGNNKQVAYVELWRMAEELGFDWLLIPRNIWLKVTGNCVQKKELVVKLLMYRPKEFYKNLLENYWDLKWKVSRGVRGAYKFMKYILTDDRKYPGNIPNREEVNNEVNRLNNI